MSTQRTPLNSGTILVTKSSTYMLMWIRKQKKFNIIPLYPCKTLCGFSKKEECNDIIKEWHTEFKMLNLKERNFLNLLNNNLSNIKSSYMKGGPWIKNFSFSNSLCTWAITNHAPIEEYQLRFFPREEFSCLCRVYPIKTRCHILYDCRRFNKYWNPRRDTISHFVSFLEFNPNTFSFV